MKCEKCRYKKRDQIQGHGEYWGECNVATYLAKMMKETPWVGVRNDNDECMFTETIKKRSQRIKGE